MLGQFTRFHKKGKRAGHFTTCNPVNPRVKPIFVQFAKLFNACEIVLNEYLIVFKRI